MIGSPWGTPLEREGTEVGAVTEEPLTVHRPFTSVSDTPVLGILVITAVAKLLLLLCLPRRFDSVAFCSWGNDLSHGFPPAQERPKLFSSPSRKLNLNQDYLLIY